MTPSSGLGAFGHFDAVLTNNIFGLGFEDASTFEKMASRAKNRIVFPQKYANALYA